MAGDDRRGPNRPTLPSDGEEMATEVFRQGSPRDSTADGPSTLERQDRYFDGPPTLVQQRDEATEDDPAIDEEDVAETRLLIADEPSTAASTVVLRQDLADDHALPIPPRTQPPRSRRHAASLWIFAAAVGALALGSLVAWFWLHEPPGSRHAQAPAESAAPRDGRSGVPTTAPSPSGPAGQAAAATSSGLGGDHGTATEGGRAKASARAALEQLRDGLKRCVRDVIGVLPGSSPAVPARIERLAQGSYQSTERDWSSPVFYCMGFRLEEPQPFVLQWTQTEPTRAGTASAWYDEDGDGRIDGVLTFGASQLSGELRFTGIESVPLEQMPLPSEVGRGAP